MLFNITNHYFHLGSKWINLMQSSSYNTKVFENVLVFNNIDVHNHGEYECQALNGIEPSLWTRFHVQVLGIVSLIKV